MEPNGPRSRAPGAPAGAALEQEPRTGPVALSDLAGSARSSASPAPRWHPVPWLLTLLVPLVVFGFAAARIARAFGLGATPIAGISAEELFVRTLIVDVPLIAGTLLLARWLLRARPADLGLRRPAWADLRYGLIFGTGLFLASVAIGLVQAAVVGKEPQAIAQALLGHRGPLALALDLVSVAVLTPLAEELVFRGLLFGGLRQRLPFIAAATLGAAPFTLLHEPQAWPGVFVLSFGLALAYERTRTLWAPIAAHATVNGIPLLLIALSGR